jgi:hypothetical protein
METAWSTMWNVTDETPINCRRFLDGGGMQLFLKCKEVRLHTTTYQGRCYDHNFQRRFPIFGEENWAFFSKTNVMLHLLQN